MTQVSVNAQEVQDAADFVRTRTYGATIHDHGIYFDEREVNVDIVSKFDGTKRTYDYVMRKWFLENGANFCSSEELTELCKKWYSMTRDGWSGYTEFAQPDVSALSTGTKGGDNEGLICIPSTDTVAERDDYAGLPLFACVDVNYIVDPDSLDIIITAIDGITDNFVRNSPDHFVGVMQMTGYHYFQDDNDQYYRHYYADHKVDENYSPLPEAVKVDGVVRAFVVHSKYMNHTVDGKMTSYSGVIPSCMISHNTCHTLSAATGAQYSGSTTVDWAFLVTMTYIKYASLTLDGIMQGCCAYNGQYYAQISETGVKRVVVPVDTVIEKGSSVFIGTYQDSTDRGEATVYSISTNSAVEVLDVEDYSTNSINYKAVYVDIDETFDTVANGDATSGSTIISTFYWKTGTTDGVLGNDGSYKDSTSGKYPYKIQGIEIMMGGYEVLADVIMNLASNSYTPHIVKESAKQSTAITSDYVALTGLSITCPSSAGWQYIKKLGYQDGVFYPSTVGGSSSTYTKDVFYMSATGMTGTREWLAFGNLATGSGFAGLSFLNGYGALSFGYWGCSARLSPNGNRG